MSRDSSVSIMTDYGLNNRGSFPGRCKKFSLRVQTAFGPTQPRIQCVGRLGALSPGHEADHSPASSAEVKEKWSYTSTTPYVFMSWC
jgi:hypothetical protein